MLGSTFGGSHLACAAGIAVLDILKEEGLLQNAKAMHQLLIKDLAALEGVKEVRAEGLMIGLEMEYPSAALRKYLLYQKQVFTGSSSCPNTLRLLPPLSITEKEVSIFLEKICYSSTLV